MKNFSDVRNKRQQLPFDRNYVNPSQIDDNLSMFFHFRYTLHCLTIFYCLKVVMSVKKGKRLIENMVLY